MNLVCIVLAIGSMTTKREERNGHKKSVNVVLQQLEVVGIPYTHISRVHALRGRSLDYSMCVQF